VYVPVETPWLADARRCGLRVVERGGVEMLARQGAAAFERWFGVDAPLDEMRDALGL
jgi:shikimate dehydrogenase